MALHLVLALAQAHHAQLNWINFLYFYFQSGSSWTNLLGGILLYIYVSCRCVMCKDLWIGFWDGGNEIKKLPFIKIHEVLVFVVHIHIPPDSLFPDCLKVSHRLGITNHHHNLRSEKYLGILTLPLTSGSLHLVSGSCPSNIRVSSRVTCPWLTVNYK